MIAKRLNTSVQFAVALFILLSTSARTGIIRTRFLIYAQRLGTCVFAGVSACSSGCTGSLGCLLHRIFLRAITTIVLTALLLCLLYMIGFLLMDLSAQQDSDCTAVEVIQHAFEDVK